jgi:glycosyltransferase involved in cell wall biosynthesis
MNPGVPRVRLALVGPLPPPSGGMANQTRQLASLLRAEGVNVSIGRTNEPLRPAWLRSLRGVRGLIHQLPYRRSLSALTRRADVMHVMANSGWAWFLLAAPAIEAAVRDGVPVLVNYRGGLAHEFLQRSGKRVLPVLRRADALVVPSPFLQEVFAAHGVKARIIPNIVDLETFSPAGRPLARPEGRAHIVISRNLEALYGIDTALRAVALLRGRVPNVRLSIAGSGPERAELERLSSLLGLTDIVRFTGRLELGEMAKLYRDADLVLNPSRADNTPNSLLEAAACGVPIVSTDVGGVPYLVQHGVTAWLVPVDAPDEMAEGITRVLDEPDLRNTLCANASALARSCSWPAVKQQWLDLYEQLALQRTRGTAAVTPT